MLMLLAILLPMAAGALLPLWRPGASRARRADRDHRYFVCKKCGAVCRVPVGKGKIIITCPKCGAQIHART